MHPTVSVDGVVGYHLVHDGTLKAKDDEIERLKAELKSTKEMFRAAEHSAESCCLVVNQKNRQIESLKDSLAKARGLIEELSNTNLHLTSKQSDPHRHELRAALNECKKESAALKRLMNDRGTYDVHMVESFDEKTPEELAKFVEFELANGGKTTFAAACLVLMWLKYEYEKNVNQNIRENIAKAADVIQELHTAIDG